MNASGHGTPVFRPAFDEPCITWPLDADLKIGVPNAIASAPAR
jgi:hypothetical protein